MVSVCVLDLALSAGRLTIGSDPSVDILVQGTGVDPAHCYIENTGSVVTLFPLAEMTSVDGVRVMIPTKLTQGQCGKMKELPKQRKTSLVGKHFFF